MPTPVTLITLAELASTRQGWTAGGERVAFVPTMGALHEGHLSLVRQARDRAARVLVSIFVNPLQFGPSEDFAKYPRTLRADIDLLGSQGVDAVFLPNATSMYPDGFQTFVHSKGLALDLDGPRRPGHFEGVLTVVLKLFHLVQPHVALFGKKDYQQWRLIAQMVSDLALPVEVVGVETLREADGLALSSRNRYLADTERPLAARLSQGLRAGLEAYAAGSREPRNVVDACRLVVDGVQGLNVEYVELRRQQDLRPFPAKVDAPAVLLIAATIGATRLIDNLEMG